MTRWLSILAIVVAFAAVVVVQRMALRLQQLQATACAMYRARLGTDPYYHQLCP